MGVIRSWRCLSSRCGQAFDSWDPNPACGACGCVRVEWVPGGGHIAGVSKGADKELRALADIFRMDDINSARRDERAKPKLDIRPQATSGPAMKFGEFSAHVDPANARTQTNHSGAQCVPTANSINFKTSAPVGQALAGVGAHRKVT